MYFYLIESNSYFFFISNGFFSEITEKSNETNKKPFLPVFISETLSDVYYKISPEKKKEVIKAVRASGIENSSMQQFLGDFYQNINIYDNSIYLFGKGFESPLANPIIVCQGG